ncbi:hypothetical protein L7Q78_16105 [Achromobacter xylosoxidans]|uniref:hypothetical protein n=2 Tax=Alcaligenes xylosoxydans xylosoxydans TaxID=85698 RepID=UPI001F0D9645|nr:hypothetical protein [Achromobacter xylosoxidans]MCH1994310.1 hypothetical protein [Achromobacter xylosoxidans]MCH4580162.1 hypothetical protein [Achromobacter xylosoxidans]
MQSLLTDTLLPTTATASNDAPAAARRDADAARDRAAAQPADKPVSIRVILSDDALERAAKARKAAFQMATNAAQSRHDLARARVAQIKQRIDTLKKMLMFLGKAAAKAILRELRQLAGELGQAASALKDSGGVQAAGASPGAAAAPVVHGASGVPATGDANGTPAGTAEGADATGAGAPTPTTAASRALAAYAAASDTALDSDADTADTPAADTAAQGAAAAARADAAKAASASVDTDTAGDRNDKAGAPTESRHEPQAAQKRREGDAQAVRDAIRAMKELLAMLKSKLRQHDKEAQKQVAEVRDALAEAEKTAQAIDGGGAAVGVGGMEGGDATTAAA